jgi:hypothetical protein
LPCKSRWMCQCRVILGVTVEPGPGAMALVIATEAEGGVVLVPPGCRVSARGPGRSESLNPVGLTERRGPRLGPTESGPPRGSLGDWSGPMAGADSEVQRPSGSHPSRRQAGRVTHALGGAGPLRVERGPPVIRVQPERPLRG